MTYEQTKEIEYTAVLDFETEILFPSLRDCDIIQVTKEIEPEKFMNYEWDNSLTKLSFLNGEGALQGQTIFILFGKQTTV